MSWPEIAGCQPDGVARDIRMPCDMPVCARHGRVQSYFDGCDVAVRAGLARVGLLCSLRLGLVVLPRDRWCRRVLRVLRNGLCGCWWCRIAHFKRGIDGVVECFAAWLGRRPLCEVESARFSLRSCRWRETYEPPSSRFRLFCGYVRTKAASRSR